MERKCFHETSRLDRMRAFSFFEACLKLRNFLSVIISIAVLSLFSATSFSADCTQTVMGGGCTSQAEAGVAPHMRTQTQVDKAIKAQTTAKPTTKSDLSIKAVKVSNVTK